MLSRKKLISGVVHLRSNIKKLFFSVAVIFGMVVPMAFTPAMANALSATAVYDNIPSPLPGNIPSEGPEAYAFAELGGQVQLAGTGRTNPIVTVAMSSWACETGHWYDATCVTTPGATTSYPITANVYAVNPDNSPGTKLATITQTFTMPYRPSTDNTNCTGGRWYNGTSCFNGKAFTISFNFTGLTLPDKVIVGVAYNTSHYGYAPVGEAPACYTSSAGCFYDSLNIGLGAPPSVGLTPLPNDAYLFSNLPGAYCAGNQNVVGSFRLDTGCWDGYQPTIRIEIPAPSKEDCKNNGWRTMTSPGPFKNQGDCVSYFATKGRNLPSGL